MGTREEDVDDIIGVAEELQQADRDEAAAPTVKELERVAQELDIEPGYVKQAIDVLDSRRAEQSARVRLAAVGALSVAGLALMVGLMLFGVGWSRLSAAQQDLQQAEQALESALHRQEYLVPQLVALAGGGATDLRAPSREAPIEEQLAASAELSQAMTQRLAALPPETSADLRLQLQHELSGSANRIAVERRRWEKARTAQQLAEQSLPGRLAGPFF